MPGLVPGIHVFKLPAGDVDGRDKPGHDGKLCPKSKRAKLQHPSPPSPRRRPRWNTSGWRWRSRATTSTTTRTTRRRFRMPPMMRCASASTPSRQDFPNWSQANRHRRKSARRLPVVSQRCSMRCRCCRSATPSATRTWPISSSASGAFSSSMPTKSRPSSPSRRSTGCRCRCVTRTANWCARRRAATAPPAKTSPPTPAPSRTFRIR